MATKTPKTVKVEDQFGEEVEVPVGADGKSPVSPNNPPAKSVLDDESVKQAAQDKKDEDKRTADAFKAQEKVG